MKQNIKLIVASFILAMVAACSDEFTDTTPLVGITQSNFWETEDDAQGVVNTMYYYMADEEVFGRGFMWYINASDDMVTGRTKATASNIKNFTLTGDESYVTNTYENCFKGIRSANEVLYNVPHMDLSDAVKDQFLGEAYFMRAFYYFWVSSCWGNDVSGGLPILTIENMYDDRYVRPESVVDNYKQIMDDLTNAATLLPLITTYDSDNYGRAHKDACYAYMAKTCLYWAQYDNSKYDDVIYYCDMVTNSGSGRSLIDTDTPNEDFKSVFSYTNDFSSEYIWAVTGGLNRGSKLPGVMLENGGWGEYNGWGYFMPTEELYQEFENNDYRRSATILTFGDKFKFLGDTIQYYSTNSTSGFQFNKYMDIFSSEDAIGTLVNSNGDDLYTVFDLPLLRYAEVLLMKAEAEIMTGGNGDDEINSVRNRAGLANKTGCTMEDLKHERRVELAGEYANRHRDLVRWGDAQSAYNVALHGRIHDDKTDPNSTYNIVEIWDARTYNPDVNNVWMIPNDVIESSGIKQNKGYN
jgi:hypothetical protein